MSHLSPWSNDAGGKLMEHSYIGNRYVGAAMALLKPSGLWHKQRFIWCGDYSPTGYYQKVRRELKPKPLSNYEQLRSLIVNHSKKQYVVLSKIKPDAYGFRINPLPLLTASGNGAGGGDYDGSNLSLVGSWAGDIISVEILKPMGYSELIVNFGGSEDDKQQNKTTSGKRGWHRQALRHRIAAKKGHIKRKRMRM